jgi:hypothetical protein
MPIHFMHKSLQFDELCALYAVSDVCLVTSTRDGMNLVSSVNFLARLSPCPRSHYRYLRGNRCHMNTLPASRPAKA